MASYAIDSSCSANSGRPTGAGAEPSRSERSMRPSAPPSRAPPAHVMFVPSPP